MSREFDRNTDAGGRSRNSNGLYVMIGGIAVLVAVAIAVVFFVLRPQGFLQTAAVRPANAPAAQPAAPQAPAAPALTPVGTFGSWEVRCNNTPPPAVTPAAAPATPPADGRRGATAARGAGRAAAAPTPTRTCVAVLQVIDNRNKSTLMQWIVGNDDKGMLQSVFLTPTGVLVGQGVDVKVGTGPAHKINFQSCVAQQCTAAGPMDDALVKELSAGGQAQVTVVAANGRALNFGIPVTGFDKALVEMRK